MSEPWLSVALPADPYPEADGDSVAGRLDRQGLSFWQYICRRRQAGSRCRQRLLDSIAGYRPAVAALVSGELQMAARDISRDLRRDGAGEGAGARALAFLARVLEVAGEGQADDVDLGAAWVISSGAVVELPSAASPRRVIILAAGLGALRGRKVHVLGPDEDWARQALAALEPVGRLLGIALGGLFRGDEAERRVEAGRCTIVVAAAREMAFEYLRDRLRAGSRYGSLRFRLSRLDRHGPARALSLQGLDMAIIGEADATLFDGASAPIAVTGTGGVSTSPILAAALRWAALLVPEVDFSCDVERTTVTLTPAGKERLLALARSEGNGAMGRDGSGVPVTLALRALHLCVRDRDYRVVDDRIVLAELRGGRASSGAIGDGGLRRMLAVKEGLQPEHEGDVLARLPMQRFFQRYRTMGGYGATVREVATELRRVFSLPVVTVGDGAALRPTRIRVLATAADKWAAVADRLAAAESAGGTFLVGVGSPTEAASLGEVLTSRGLAWLRLDAPLAPAGDHPGVAVLVALPAAWRSSFLPPSGRFRVLLADGQPGGRLDRQLARWLEAGANPCEAILSLEDPVVVAFAGALPAAWWRRTAEAGWWRRCVYRAAQWRMAREHARLRRKLLQYDTQMESVLAFAGRGE